MRGDADQVADVRNRRASIFSPTTPLKMARTNNTRFGRGENALGFDLVWFCSNAFFPRSCFVLKLVRGTLNSIQ